MWCIPHQWKTTSHHVPLSTRVISSNHHFWWPQQPTCDIISYLQARWPSCCPTNSIKALKAHSSCWGLQSAGFSADIITWLQFQLESPENTKTLTVSHTFRVDWFHLHTAVMTKVPKIVFWYLSTLGLRDAAITRIQVLYLQLFCLVCTATLFLLCSNKCFSSHH